MSSSIFKYFLLLSFFFCQTLMAQEFSESFWYFGDNNQAIQFSKSNGRAADIITNQATPFGTNASAVAARATNGELLFYTDGSTIFGKNHQVLSGGNITGDNSLRNGVTISPSPVPNDELMHVYFITTAGDLLYVNVDLSAGTFGEVSSAPIATGITDLAPYVKSLRVGDSYFLLYQTTDDNQLKISRIENGGGLAATPSVSHTFTTKYKLNNVSFRSIGQDSLQLALSSENLGVSPSDTVKNIILLDLIGNSPSTANFTSETILTNTGAVNQKITDLEWSVGGTNLYYSRNNTTTNEGRVFQYNPDSVSTESILNRTINEALALQNGPDGLLYFLYNNGASSLLSRIQFADSISDSLNIEWDLFNNATFGNAQNLPQSAPPQLIRALVDFDWYDTQLNATICQNNPVSFFAQYDELSDISSVFWDFGDGQTSNAISPIVNFATAGSYSVKLFVNAGGNVLIDSADVTVNTFDTQVQLQDTTVCQLPLENYGPTLGDGSSPDQVVWINPDPTKLTDNGNGTATFIESGTYSAAVTVGGCTVTATFTLTLYEEGKQLSNFWYFGEGAGIDFNGDAGPQAVTDGAILAEEGCATVSDDNGDLLFYTNGETIWDSEHNEMPNGTDLGGSSDASQGVIAVAHGTDPSLHYIFLSEDQNSADNAFKVALVDMKLNNGLGAVVIKNRKIYSQNLEKIAAAGTANTTVLTHELGTNNYRSFDVNAQGINAPDYVSQGATFLTPESTVGYLKYAAGGDKIAHSYNEGGAFVDFIRIDSTGGYEYALIDVNFGGTVYGLEFSPTTNFLYVSLRNGGTSQLIQIPVDDNYSITDISNPDSVTVADLSFEAGAIQTGPNGLLYIAANNSPDVYTIGSPDNRYLPSQGSSLARSLQPFNLAGRTSRLGLPNFVQNVASPEQEPSISVIAACSADPVILAGTGTTTFDIFNWTITPTDSTASVYTSNQQNDTLDIQLNPGSYEVVLRITNECGYDNLLVENIEIFASPDVSAVISPRTFCGNTLTLGTDIVDESGHTYLWSTGETTQTIVVTSEGNYTVTVTSANGCTSIAEIFVGPPFNVDLGGDQVVCQNDNLILDANVNASIYNWYIDGVQQTAGGRTFTVPTSVIGIYTVRVEIPDPVEPNCFAVDEVEITINETPALTLTSSTNPSCTVSDGAITVTPSGGSGDYQITWSGNTTVAANTLAATGLAVGTYNITITDNLTSCSDILSVALTNSNFAVAVTQTNNCPANSTQDIQVSLFANTGTLTADFNWTVFDVTNTVLQSGTANVQPFPVTNLAVGDYSIEVIDNAGNGCTATAAFSITPPDSVAFSPDPEIFACGNYDLETYLQSITGAGITFGYSPSPADVNNITSTTTFTITATDPSDVTICPTTADVIVNISETANINTIENNVDCNGGNELTAVLTSGDPADFSFAWSNGAQGQTITVNQAGTYAVTVYPNSNVSCIATESIIVSSIYEAVAASLSSETNCQDGTVLLTAIVTGGSGNFFFTLTNSSGTEIPTTNPTDNVLEWNITSTDTYTFRLSDQGVGNCDDVVIQRDLSVQEVFEPTIQDTYFICSTGVESERTVLLDPGSFGSYLWTLPNGSTASTRTITANEPGNYTVVLSAAGCEYTVSTTVLEDCKPKVFVPNAVRPASSNAQNQTFSVFANEYVGEFQIIIYNRWGNLVFQSKDKDFQWDTTDQAGAAVPQGTYAYVITFRGTDANNKRIYEERGGVTVVR